MFNSAVLFAFAATLPFFAFSTSSSNAQVIRRGPLTLSPCTVPDVKDELRCGTFNVPEDRRKPNGRVLPLKVVVMPSRSANKAAEPIFYFEGGPGEAATGSAKYLANSFIRDRHDVVLIDQRGTGPGHSLDCRYEGNDNNLQGYISLIYPALKRCAAELSRKNDLTKYTTPIAMQDADEVRQALGYDLINIYGASYGSRAVLVYAKMFGSHVRAAYLAAPLPFEAKLPLHQSANSQRAFEASIARCAADAKCNQSYPDPPADLEAIKAELRRKPARVMIKHPVTDAPTEIVLNEWGFISGFMSMLYKTESPSYLPALLQKARKGDLTELAQTLVYSRRGGIQALHWGMNVAVTCSEDVRRIQDGEVGKKTQNTFAGSFQVESWRDMCRSWPEARYPKGFFTPFKSDIPAYIMSGSFDPVTPPSFGRIMEQYFPNSIHIVVDTGHRFDASKCYSAMVAEFLASASVANLPLDCLAKEPGMRLASQLVGSARR